MNPSSRPNDDGQLIDQVNSQRSGRNKGALFATTPRPLQWTSCDRLTCARYWDDRLLAQLHREEW
jgi:hypothetical protein